MSSYDTNLASEYFVLACLHRLGVSASLTLGNKKGVDIMVARNAGEAITVEVKGVAKRHDWPASNIQSPHPERHYIVLVCFEGQIESQTMPTPRSWIIPYPKLQKFIRTYSGRTNISRASIVKDGADYENNWELIKGNTEPECPGSVPAVSQSPSDGGKCLQSKYLVLPEALL